MHPMIRYFVLTIRHKWFVLLAGLKIGCPLWRLITHDMTKFSSSELPHYGRQFFGKANDPGGFIEAWIHHQNRNDHHWEYWIPRTGHNRCTPPYPDNVPVPMDHGAVKEMVADWMGACRAYEGKWPVPDEWKWLDENLSEIMKRMHPDTRMCVVDLLIRAGFNVCVSQEDA